MIEELDSVFLTHDVVEHGLKARDVGAVVHIYPAARAYEVEFVKAGGETVAVLTLEPREIRPLDDSEILHTRQLEQVG